MGETYIISTDGSSITCTQCGATSYNKNDIKSRYCANCHEFHEMSRCDFCMTPDVPLPGLYFSKTPLEGELNNVLSEDVTVVDTGEWMACQICKDLIDSEKWPELVRRAAERVEDPSCSLEQTTRNVERLFAAVFRN
jgi:hypothetical protein